VLFLAGNPKDPGTGALLSYVYTGKGSRKRGMRVKSFVASIAWIKQEGLRASFAWPATRGRRFVQSWC